MTHLPTPVSHLHVAPAIRSLLWTTWLALALPAASQPLFDAYVVEPWDDSYSLASSHIGDLNDLNVGVGTAHFQGATAEPFLWTPAEGKDVADVGPDDINDLGVTASFGRIWWAPGNSQAIPHPDGGVGVRIRDLNNANVVCGDAPVTERPRASCGTRSTAAAGSRISVFPRRRGTPTQSTTPACWPGAGASRGNRVTSRRSCWTFRPSAPSTSTPC